MAYAGTTAVLNRCGHLANLLSSSAEDPELRELELRHRSSPQRKDELLDGPSVAA